MTEKLDSFRPSLETQEAIKHLLLRAGMNEDELPAYHDREAIIAATLKWLSTTQDGLKYFSRLFCFKVKQGGDDKEYTVIDNVNHQAITVKNTDVWLFGGAIVRGRPLSIIDVSNDKPPPYELEISKKDRESCEGCGAHTHCLLEVLDPYTENVAKLCNYCISHHEHPKVKDCGGMKTCELCNVTSCKNKPKELRA